MKITKLQAWKSGLQQSRICEFHQHSPDQAATMETCERCQIIQDPCGCDEDSFCEDCDTVKLSELPPRKNYQIGDLKHGIVKIDAKIIDKMAEFHFNRAMKSEGIHEKWMEADALVRGTYRNYALDSLRFAFTQKAVEYMRGD